MSGTILAEDRQNVLKISTLIDELADGFDQFGTQSQSQKFLLKECMNNISMMKNTTKNNNRVEYRMVKDVGQIY